MSKARGSLKIVDGLSPSGEFRNMAGSTRPAIILTDKNSNQMLVQRVQQFCTNHGFNTCILECTNQTLIKAAQIVKIGEREKSVCYIAGASEGNDSEIKTAVTGLAQKVAHGGFHAIWPGSKFGMMGVLAQAVIGAGKPIVSVFSLDVAQAHIEELEPKASSIVVAPSERERQILYHLLSGAQIALPGGGGTHAEAAIHFYQNGQMGLMYRQPDAFTEHNYPSPIIYFSPATAKTNQNVKTLIGNMFDDLKPNIIESSTENLGYWAFEELQFKLLMRTKFLSAKAGALIHFVPNAEGVLKILGQWGDAELRAGIIRTLNLHHDASRRRLEEVIGSGLKA
jgi:predicted Rossmann-fold nucleotide-binding protein